VSAAPGEPVAVRTPPRCATVFTHRRPEETKLALSTLLALARERGVTLFFDERETEKHSLVAAEGVVVNAAFDRDVEICLTLGGDGTILTALRRYAGTGVPVFGVNFGEIGFLSAVDREDVKAGLEAAFAGNFQVLSLPGIQVEGASNWTFRERLAINDIAIQRRQGRRVADLAYFIEHDEIGRVRCDGLVVATPAGSTGYNLATGGPVMAWGVAGYVVSFIAPHSLTARALVVAPSDTLTIVNRSKEEAVDVVLDGRPMAELEAGQRLEMTFVPDRGMLAQVDGLNFYARLQEKFGRLATLP
jgi:NAD+ kinase